MFSHQIPMLLLAPFRWTCTVIPSGHHQHWTTWVDMADGTRCIVVMEIFLNRQFILSTIDETSVVLITIFVLIVLWNLWKAKIVDAPSSVSVYPCNLISREVKDFKVSLRRYEDYERMKIEKYSNRSALSREWGRPRKQKLSEALTPRPEVVN